MEEIEKHRKEIAAKAGFSLEELNLALSVISSRISFVSLPEFEKFLPKARSICPDINDTEYFALALAKSIPLWSNDKALKKQLAVKIIFTAELLKQLK